MLTIVLVAALAAGAAAANLALLRSTQDSSDPVGRLSPRAVFSTPLGATNGTGASTQGGRDDRPATGGHGRRDDD